MNHLLEIYENVTKWSIITVERIVTKQKIVTRGDLSQNRGLSLFASWYEIDAV